MIKRRDESSILNKDIYQKYKRNTKTMMGKEFPLYDVPMSEILYPEIDDSNILDSERHSHFRSLVGCSNY